MVSEAGPRAQELPMVATIPPQLDAAVSTLDQRRQVKALCRLAEVAGPLV